MKGLEKDINGFLEYFDIPKLMDLIQDIMPLCELYSFNETEDWVKELKPDDHWDLRILRTVYLISRIADKHAGRLASLRVMYPKLYDRMEKAETAPIK